MRVLNLFVLLCFTVNCFSINLEEQKLLPPFEDDFKFVKPNRSDIFKYGHKTIEFNRSETSRGAVYSSLGALMVLAGGEGRWS